MRCALALIMYKLGVNYYETEELSEGLAHLKKSLELMDSLPDQFKLRHLNTVQDLYNHIGLIYSQRDGDDNNKNALAYLEQSQKIHAQVTEHTDELP